MIVTQRSRIETFESCQRRGYYAYLHGSRGVQRKGFDPDLLMGASVHTGIEHLLKGSSEDDAAAEAVIAFNKAHNAYGLAPRVVETSEGFGMEPFTAPQSSFMINLVEALVRGFARVRLPKILEEFTILSVEREESYAITSELVFLSRSDFIAERKRDGDIFVFNLKTVKYPDGHWRKKFQYDTQTLSELLGPEARFGKKFGGVIIEGLVKGSKNIEYPKGSGFRYNNSPLLWAWAGPENYPFPPDLKISYEYVDGAGKSRRLGPSYTRKPAYEVMPIREWIDKVEREEPLLLAGQFVTLPAVLRSEREIESWKTTTEYREAAWDVSKRLLDANPGNDKVMDITFPRTTSNGNCLGFGETTCPFFPVCWLNTSPDDEETYQPRRYNHPTEEELCK